MTRVSLSICGFLSVKSVDRIEVTREPLDPPLRKRRWPRALQIGVAGAGAIFAALIFARFACTEEARSPSSGSHEITGTMGFSEADLTGRREVTADHKRLLQVMTNLLSNAAKFSAEGQVVEISTEERSDCLRVAVHDRGPGIPEAFRARVFGRFNQADSTTSRQKGGTGLGLAICKRLVELMQGHIGFHDREGGGTTFWFELPRHA